MTAPDFEVFDAYGKVRKDFSREEVAALSDDKAERLLALVSACQNGEAAEAALKLAEKELRLARRDLDTLRAEKEKLYPARSRLDELRAMGLWSG